MQGEEKLGNKEAEDNETKEYSTQQEEKSRQKRMKKGKKVN